MARLCFECSRGNHSLRHGPTGCLALVSNIEPRDWVCQCLVIVGPRVLSALPEVEDEDAV
jgi:hypothetical protein